MKRALQLSLLLFLLLSGSTIFAQAPKFDVIPGGATVNQDSFFLQVTNPAYVIFEVKVVFAGPGTYTGPLRLQSYYQEKGFSDTIFTPDTLLTDVMTGDTITFSHQDQVEPTSTRFKGGGNIVIVWPYSPAITVGDSGEVEVWFDGIISIDKKIILGNRVSLFPNPAVTRLSLQYMEDKYLLEQVRITTIEGKQVFQTSNTVEDIDLTSFPRGIYMVTITYTDGISGTYKLILRD